jgi:hypothetical protein
MGLQVESGEQILGVGAHNAPKMLVDGIRIPFARNFLEKYLRKEIKKPYC